MITLVETRSRIVTGISINPSYVIHRLQQLHEYIPRCTDVEQVKALREEQRLLQKRAEEDLR